MRVFAILLALGAMLSTMGAAYSEETESKVLRHVVLFKFKADATKEQIKSVTDAFSALPKKIDAISDFEWGTDVSPEKRAQGFTDCFLVTFASDKKRDEYLPHAAHAEFAKLALPLIEDVLVVDYWAKK